MSIFDSRVTPVSGSVSWFSSHVAMALRSASYTLPSGGAIDPGTLNTWLQANDGYRCDRGDCNNLVLDAPDRLTNGRFRYVGEWDNTSLSVASVAANIASLAWDLRMDWGLFPDGAATTALDYKTWGALTQMGFGEAISNERAIIMIAHIHALVVSAAAAFGPQVSAAA